MAAGFFFRSARHALFAGDISLRRDNLWMLLVTEAPDELECATREDIVALEAEGPGYRALGLQMEGRRIEKEGGSDYLYADDLIWEECTLRDIPGGVIYIRNDRMRVEDPLVAYIEFKEPLSSTNGRFWVKWQGKPVLKG